MRAISSYGSRWKRASKFMLPVFVKFLRSPSPRMLRWPPGFLAVLALGAFLSGSPVRAQDRLWTDMDGRRYDATIVSLFNGQATFRRPDGRTITLAQNDLVAADQLVLREWLAQQQKGVGVDPPPAKSLSPFGRSFVLDEPRVLHLRPQIASGYPSAYLGVPVTLRNDRAGVLEFVNVYFYDDQRKRIPFSIPPPNSPIIIQDGDTIAFRNPNDFKRGQTYMVLMPIHTPDVRLSTSAVVVAGNSLQTVATVYPDGSWRDYDFPERDRVALDPYADYSGQELYTEKKADELFTIMDVTRLQPTNGDHTPEHDFFRISLRFLAPFPAVALSGRWYAFDKLHQPLHAEDLAPYAQPNRKDGFDLLLLAGRGPAGIADAVPRTEGQAWHTLQLPGAAWWDKPEVDSIVFVFGTETKKIARVFSKSGATLADLPVPEKEAFGDAKPAPQSQIPTTKY